MKKNSLFILLILLLSSILFFSSNCKSSHTILLNQGEIVRFINILNEKNIIETPLKNISNNFEKIEENLAGRWVPIKNLSNKDYKAWGISTKYSILGKDENEPGWGMKLYRNGEEIKFINEAKNKDDYWIWFPNQREIFLKEFDNFNGKKNGAVLYENDNLNFEIILPKGDIIIDTYIVNPFYEKMTPEVVLLINEKPVETFLVTSKKFYRFRYRTEKIDRFNISFKLKGLKSPVKGDDKYFIIIGMIKIKHDSNPVLLFLPQSEKVDNKIKSASYKLKYFHLSEKKERELEKSDSLKYIQILFDRSFKKFLDLGNNIYNLKKKLFFRDKTINIVYAPPKSLYKFKLKIPKQPKLEFGYGFIPRKRTIAEPDKKDEKILFVVEVKANNIKKIVFSRELNLFKNEKPLNIFYESINLDEFQDKEITISFITEGKYSGLVFWANPLLYTKDYSRNPNIILISIDTLRPDHLGCYGYSRNTSPNLDQLSKESIIFKNCFSTTSWTLPAHISLLTSLTPANHQVYFPSQKMKDDTITLSYLLQNKNYYCVGFTGGGYLSAEYGFGIGFDLYNQYILQGDPSRRYNEAEEIAQQAIEWIKANKDKKFFLFLHTYQPHDPYLNYSSWGKIFLEKNFKWSGVNLGKIFTGTINRFNAKFSKKEMENIIALYDGEIRYTDEEFLKPLINTLKDLGLYDDSIIVFTSDHGEEFNEHQAWLHDHSLYNEAIKIPLIIKFPNSLHKGKVINQIVRLTDIMPTLLDYLSYPFNNLNFDGSSLLNIISGKKEYRSFLCDLALRNFKEEYPAIIAANKDNLKLIINKKIHSPYLQKVGVPLENYKIELYDLSKDPKEKNNIAKQKEYKEIIFSLIKMINKYYKLVDKKRTGTINPSEELKERLRSLGYIKN